METKLDQIYQQQRVDVIRSIQEAVALSWVNRRWNDNSSFTRRAIPQVEGGMLALVKLLVGYYNLKSVAAAGAGGLTMGIDHTDYTISKLRGVDALVVYSRPFGTLGAKLNQGLDFKTADEQADKYAQKLASTDMQLATTKSSQEWMEQHGDKILGYRRVFDGGCDFCLAASQKLYHKSDLMPIHEGCNCGIAPVFRGESHGMKFHPKGAALPDSELGARLDQSGPVPAESK